MKKRLLSLAIACLPVLGGMKAQISTNPDKFLGNITTEYTIDYASKKFYEYWNQITPENESKWDQVEGSRNSFNWTNTDRIKNYAKQHNFPFKWHTLIWGSQYPKWMDNLSQTEQLKAITEWMDAIKKKYPDLELIDVVNEALPGHAPAPYKNALGGDGKTGYDWIIKAFEMAHDRWPNAILIYNDYNTFQWNTDGFIDLVRKLRDAGAPIDAYGCQSHDLGGVSKSTFQSVMTKIQNALKIPMYITEYDIGDTDDGNQSWNYQQHFPVMWEADYCAGVTLWGWHYGHTWINTADKSVKGISGLIKNGTERSALTWLRDYMKTDAAKTAKSPFPGMKKEASVYVKPSSNTVFKGDKVPVEVRATMRTKTIDHVDLYVKNQLYTTMNEAPYTAEVEASALGKYDLKAVVVNTDGTKYERLSSFTAYNQRVPYTTLEMPGTIQAEHFDKCADGITYHDTDATNQGTNKSLRTDSPGVDIENFSGGVAIGYISSGEWLEYTVDVKEAGLYEYDAYFSSQDGGGSFSIALSGDNGLTDLTGTIPVVKTSAWSTYKVQHGRFTKQLQAGKQTLRFIVQGGNNAFNFDKIVLNRIDVDNAMTISVKASPAPATVSENSTITVTANSNTSTIANVKIYADNVLLKTLTEAPFETTYKPTAKGTVKITAIATDADGKQSKVASYSLTVNNKRSAYKTISLPGTLQFEDFDKGGEGLTFHDGDTKKEGDSNYRSDGEGVDFVNGNGGTAIGYTANNEWLEYTVNVTKAGIYNCVATVSSGNTGSSFTISLRENGQSKQLAKFNVPQTANNDWGTYKTVKVKLSQELPEGTHILRVTITGANCNLDKAVFSLEESQEEPVTTADPNFYVYLCLGQSNMEGNATPESVDRTCDERFQMLACVDFSSPQRTMGEWYTATPPIVRQGTGLGMADYFGRTMVANLPENVKVGVVDVAIGGTRIEGFMSEKVASYLQGQADWLKNYFAAYDNDPYKRLVDMAKIAQKKGVIKGILLHQGESNNGENDWPTKVKTVYDRLISDLGLTAANVPLFVGETVNQTANGSCSYHNTVIANVPKTIPNSYVISSANCPAKPEADGSILHFNAQGYRMMGARYAKKALELMGIDAVIDETGLPSSELEIDKRFTSLSAIGTTPFAIIDEQVEKAIYGSTEQHLGFADYGTAFADANSGYLFKLEKVTGGYLLRLITPGGTEYQLWGGYAPGYLNGYSTQTDCSFILGLNNQNGQDVKNGALWDIQYVSGKGFTLKNLYTNKYLKDALSAKYDEPTYFTFATLRQKKVTGIDATLNNNVERVPNGEIYNLNGQRVSTPVRGGLYIINGKKVFIK